MPHPNPRSGLIPTRLRPHAALVLVLAAAAATACTRTPVAKVTRADGGAPVIGEVVGSRPDVVVLRLRAGDELTIRRAAIRSIEVPTVDEFAYHSTGLDGSESDARHGDNDGAGMEKDGGDSGASGADGRGADTDGSDASGSNSGRSDGGGSDAGEIGGDGPGGAGRSGGPGDGSGGASGSGGSGGTGASRKSGGPGGADGSSGTGTAAHDGAAPPGGSLVVVRDAVIPEDTALTVALAAAVTSDRTPVKTPIEATLTAPVRVTGGIALPIGTRLLGAVTEAVPGSLARGRGRLSLHFHSLVIAGQTIHIDTDAVPFRAPGLTRDDAKKIGIGAAIGAGLGKVVSKTKRGLGIGGATGAAATAAVVGRKDVELARGATLRIVLNEPVALGAARDR